MSCFSSRAVLRCLIPVNHENAGLETLLVCSLQSFQPTTFEGGGDDTLQKTNVLRVTGGSAFEANKAVRGGAIYAETLSVLQLSDTRFSDNLADGAGGAIHFADGSELSVDSSVFLNNSVGGTGGAVHFEFRFAGTELSAFVLLIVHSLHRDRTTGSQENCNNK